MNLGRHGAVTCHKYKASVKLLQLLTGPVMNNTMRMQNVWETGGFCCVAGLSLADNDDECCPTCLEAYTSGINSQPPHPCNLPSCALGWEFWQLLMEVLTVLPAAVRCLINLTQDGSRGQSCPYVVLEVTETAVL